MFTQDEVATAPRQHGQKWSVADCVDAGQENCVDMGKLKGIPHILSPDILHLLAVTGHGDEIGKCQVSESS